MAVPTVLCNVCGWFLHLLIKSTIENDLQNTKHSSRTSIFIESLSKGCDVTDSDSDSAFPLSLSGNIPQGPLTLSFEIAPSSSYLFMWPCTIFSIIFVAIYLFIYLFIDFNFSSSGEIRSDVHLCPKNVTCG